VFAVSVLVCVLAYQMTSFRANHDAFGESSAALADRRHELIERLVAVETEGMMRKEEGGVVYYHSSARTGKRHRVYLLWQLVSARTRMHESLMRALQGKPGVPKDADLAIVAYVDVRFHTFRARHKMQLGRLFEERGLGGMRAICYRRDETSSSWSRLGELENAVAASLLTRKQKRAIGMGTFNMVNVVNPDV